MRFRGGGVDVVGLREWWWWGCGDICMQVGEVEGRGVRKWGVIVAEDYQITTSPKGHPLEPMEAHRAIM